MDRVRKAWNFYSSGIEHALSNVCSLASKGALDDKDAESLYIGYWKLEAFIEFARPLGELLDSAGLGSIFSGYIERFERFKRENEGESLY